MFLFKTLYVNNLYQICFINENPTMPKVYLLFNEIQVDNLKSQIIN